MRVGFCKKDIVVRPVKYLCFLLSRGSERDGFSVTAEERAINAELEAIASTDISGLEAFCSRHQNTLHKKHALLMRAKQMLSVGYGRFPGHEKEVLTPKQVERKAGLCREVLVALTALENDFATRIGTYVRTHARRFRTNRP